MASKTHSGRSSLRAAYPILAFLLALSLSTCDLFKVGLGEKVDISAPTLEITSPTNGSYITGVVHLKGTASDDTGVASVSVAVSFPASSGLSAKNYTAAFSDGQWSLDFDSAALAPGIEVNANVLVTATDLASKTSEQKIIIYVDNNPPIVKLTSPTADDLANAAYYVNGSLRFRGAADPDVANLYLDVGGMPFSPSNGNNASFSIQVDTDAFSDGDVPFKLWAVDNAGNHSVESVGTLHILQSSDTPKLSFKGADNADIVDLSSTSKSLGTNRNNFKRGDTINGTISDDDGLDFSSLKLTLTNSADPLDTRTFSQGAALAENKISIKTLGTNTDPDYPTAVTSASFSFTIPTGMAQGIYYLSYSLSDSAAAKLPKQGDTPWPVSTIQDSGIYFVIDDGQPTTTITSPSPGAFVQSLQAAGIAQEGLGIKAVEYQIDGITEGAWTRLTNAANDTPFSWSFSQGGFSEGGHKLYARPISKGNSTGQAVSVDFTIDVTPPSVQILSAAPSSTSSSAQVTAFAAVSDASVDGGIRSTVNGVTRIKGYASDTAALKKVSWVVTRKSDGGVVETGTIASAKMASWNFDLDTTSGTYADGARYVVTVSAEDQAGNSSLARLTIDVSQASDNPTLSLTGWKTVSDLAHAKENLLVSDPKVSAVVYDDDWVDDSSVYILFNKAPGDAGATWKAVPSTSQADGSAALVYGFSADGASGTALPEGPNYFYLRASDFNGADGRKSGKATVTTTIGPIYFVIDTIQPTISFTQTGGLYVSSSQALSGTVSSGNALDPSAPLSFTPEGGSTTVLTASDLAPGPSSMGSHTWNYTLDVSHLSDGPVSITATARDEYGLPGSASFVVTVDKTPPVVTVSNAATAFSDINGYLLTGTAKDVTSGLQQMTAVVKSGATDVSSSTVFTLSSVTSNPNTMGNWSLDVSGLASGTYTVDLKATDKAGNIYQVTTFPIIVDKDLPVATVDNAGGQAVDGAVYNAASVMPASWSGQATDLYFASGKVSFDGTKIVDLASSGSWSFLIDWNHVSEGKHTLKVEVTDQGGHNAVTTATFTKDTLAPVLTVVKPALSSWIQGASSVISGTADDRTAGTGVADIYYKVDTVLADHSSDDVATISSSWSHLDGAVSWSDTIDLASLGEGAKKLWVCAKDAAGNWSAPLFQAFGIDQNRPEISETEINTDSRVNRTASFDIAGTVSDSNPDGAPTLTLSIDGGTAQPVTLTAGAYRVTITVDTATHTTDGDHTYVLTVTDVSGKTNTPQMKRLVHIDTSAPAVTLGNLAADGSTVILDTSLMKVMGSITDATAIASATSTIEYSPDYGSTWEPVESAASLGSPSGLAWSFSKSLAGAAFSADGLYRISVTASDSLGNTASSVALKFYLDRTDPVVSLDALTKTALKKAFTATGTAFSANITGVSWSLDSDTAKPLVGPFAPGVSNGISIPLTQADVDGLLEGPHKLEVQATSLGGRIGRYTLAFTVDRSAPSVSFTNISAAGDSVMTESSPRIIGAASDATAVALVERKIERWNGSSWGTTSDFTAMGSAAGTNYTWTADLSNATTYPDGKYQITIRTTDDTDEPNSATGSAVVFYIDRTVPTVSITSPASGAAYNQGFTIIGTADDANLTSVSAKLDGVTDLTVSGSAAWSIALTTTQVQGFSEGPHSISVTAKDVAGNSSIAQVLSFRTDHTAPGLSWFNISGSGGTVVQDSAPKISGTLTDESGIASATATLEHYDYSTGLWSVVPAWNGASLGVTGSPTSYSWSVDISNSTNYPDGRYRLTIAASDITTPANSLAGTPVMFMLSRSNPETSVLGPAMGSYQNAEPIFWGKASDPNGITSVLAKIGTGGVVDFKTGTTAAYAGVAVTLDPSTDTFSTSSAHGLQNDDLVYLACDEGGSLPSANGTTISSGTAYYVVSTASKSFSLSLTSGGAAIDFTASGSALFAASSRLTFGKTEAYWLVPKLGLGGATDGAMTAWVQTTAGSGKTSMASRDFTLDATKPIITISSPSSGTRSVGSLTIIGATSDPGSLPSGITGTIQYKIGCGTDPDSPAGWTNASVTGGAYSWSISLGLMSAYANETYATKCDASGNSATTGNLWKLPIYFQAVDKAGNVQTEKNYWLILDPDGNIPVVTITQPSLNAQTYGGEQRITGMATQPVWIHDVEVAIDPSGGASFPEAVAATISGSTVNATGHGLANGRSVYFSATASLPKVGGVSVSASIPYFVVNATANAFQVATKPDGTALAFSDNGSGVMVGVWGPATLLSTGNSVMWYHDINLGNYLPQGGATSQTISVQARAWNSPAAGGATRGSLSGTLLTPLTMKFDSTFPKIQGMKVSPSVNYSDVSAKSYYSQISVGGQIYILGYVVSSKGIKKIEKVETSMGSGATALYDTSGGAFGATSTVTPPASIPAGSFPNGGSYQLIITSLGDTDWNALGFVGTPTLGSVFKPNGLGSGSGTAIPSDSSGNFSYYFAIPVDTSTGFPNTSGVYSFDVRATDMTTPSQVSSQSIALDVDNYYPTATFLSPASVVGTQYQLQGTATDVGTGSGTISSFKRVVVYLTRSGNVINMLDGSTSAIGSIVAKDGGTGTIGSFDYPSSSGSGVMASVDDLLENNSLPGAGGTDHNGDGFYEYLGMTGTTYNWDVQIDSTKIPDGPAVVHYVAFDSVGNATHYQQSVYVKNHAPTITSITLGTDLNGDGLIGAGELDSPYNTTATSFIARNSLMSIKATTPYAGANGVLSYKLEYYNAGSWVDYSPGLPGVSLDTTNDPTYKTNATITVSFASLSTAIADAASNAAQFRVTITDSTPGGGQAANFTFTIGIQNRDTTPPLIDLAPMGQRYWPLNAATADADKTLLAVAAYADNLQSGAGHVEYAADSRYNPVTLTVSSSDTFLSSSAHNLLVNSIVYLSWTTSPGLGTDTGPYYVQSIVDSTHFRIAKTKSAASPINVLSGGTGIKLATADISGKLVLYGKAWDNQRISRITAKIAGFNGGNGAGNEFDVATWGGSSLTALSGTGWSFVTESSSEGLTQMKGHVLNWAFNWDSSLVAGGAAGTVPVVFTVYDFWTSGSGTSAGSTFSSGAFSGMSIPAGTPIWVGTTASTWASGSWTTLASAYSGTGSLSLAASVSGTKFVLAEATKASYDVDVVPYITDMSRQSPFLDRLSDNTMNPGKGGYYPVYQGNTGYVIKGYNLPADSDTIDGTNYAIKVGAISLSSPTGVAERTKVTADIPVALASGALVVTTNGIASINNLNDNGKTYNTADEGGFTDDRYVYVDDQSPTITVAAFGQTFPVQDSDDSATGHSVKAAQAVSDYTQNVPYSGSDKTIRANWLGHVEYGTDSAYGDGYANVSGLVTFRGKAADNQRIQKITATIPNYDGGAGSGTEFNIYTLPGGMLSNTAKGWTAALDGSDYKLADSSRVAYGHVLNWTFTWDSSKITNGAQKAVTITFTVYDMDNTALTATSTITVDVVPYISSITRDVNIYNTNRSKYGRYPIAENEAGIVVLGFNLPVAINGTNWVKMFNASGAPNGTTGTADSNVPTITGAAGATVSSISGSTVTTSAAHGYTVGQVVYFSATTAPQIGGVSVSPATPYYVVAVPTTTTLKVSATSGGSAVTFSSAGSAVTTSTGRRGFTMKLNAAQQSGWLRVATNSVEAINNFNSISQAWDKEDDGSGLGSTKWTDDRYISVWNVDRWSNGNTFLGSTTAQYPTFAVSSDGTLYGSWINYASASVYYNTIAGTDGAAGTATRVFRLYDPPEFTDISIDQANDQPTIAYSMNTYGGSGAWDFDNSGSINIWESDISTNARFTQTYTNYAFRADGLYHNSMLWEYYSPRVVRSGGNIHVAWYDDASKSIKYAYFVSTLNTSNEQGWINIDGGTTGTSDSTSPGIGYVTNFASGLSRTASVGSSVSIDVDKAGYPVIAYYDNANHVLRIAHANKTNPTALADWKVQAVSGGTYDSYAGANSSDKNGNITLKINHSNGLAYLIAYRPSKGQLVYGTAGDRAASGSSNTDYSFSALSLLDANGNVGSWSDLSITGAATAPVMVYQNKSMLGTYDGVKVAYWDSSLATPDWETMVAPANTYVGDGKLSIAYNTGYTGVTWTMAVGFKSSAFNVMFLQPTN